MSQTEKQHILSLSYGKDSLACLGAIEELGWPLDGIIHAEVWATDTIPADLPPMIEFKAKADKIIKERWGIDVEHVCATCTFQDVFYKQRKSGKHKGQIHGFPMQIGSWCNDRLKTNVLDAVKKLTYEDVFCYVRGEKSKRPGQIYGSPNSSANGPWCTGELKQNKLKKEQRGCVSYLGIASDEPNRFGQLSETKKSPLVEIGWDEAYCRQWCEENDLLSPIYTTATRGGCWFCHNQGVNQLRLLRKNYPNLWALMLKWDADSPVTFRADGHTVHDFDRRFQMEDEKLISSDDKVFRWSMLDAELNYRIF